VEVDIATMIICTVLKIKRNGFLIKTLEVRLFGTLVWMISMVSSAARVNFL
jgi:hypothetical protein